METRVWEEEMNIVLFTYFFVINLRRANINLLFPKPWLEDKSQSYLKIL